jgi:F-type H+-transporting ATPase subunit delta
VRSEVIARNYADTLLALAQRHGGAATAQEFLTAAEELASLLQAEPRIRAFLATPGISAEAKKNALRGALQGRVPELFLRFVLLVVDKRRDALLREIAAAYRDRVDEMMGRVRVDVRISHAPDAALQDEIRQTLQARLGREVIPTFTVDPELLGGMVMRMGDQILDGSVRSQAAGLRRRLMEATVPHAAAAV